jgi:beta-lactamase regulating signal transducer with metallopeptidase domain
MIATWMLGVIVASALFACVGALMEAALRARGRATRWAWVAGLVGAVAVTLAPLLIASSAAGSDAATRVRVSAVSDAPRRPAIASEPVRSGGHVDVANDVGRDLASIARNGVRELRRVSAPLDGPLVVLWGLATGVLALVLAIEAIAVRRLVRSSVGRVVQSASVGPAAVGVWSPRILLPRWWRELSCEERRLVVRHEHEHLRARDPLTLAGAIATAVLFPWNAPLWWMLRRLRLAIEIDCDARVLRAAPDVRVYASLLIALSQRVALAPSRQLLLSPGMSPIKLHARIIAMTTTPQRPRRVYETVRMALAAVGIASAVGISTAIRPVSAQTSRAITTRAVDTRSTRAASDSLVEFRFVATIAGYFTGGDRKTFIYTFSRSDSYIDPSAGFISARVRSVSGRPVDVLMYVRRRPGDRALKSDTLRARTPMTFVGMSDSTEFHVVSLSGDSLAFDSPGMVAPAWATRIIGTHVVMRGQKTWGASAIRATDVRPR